MLPHSVVSLSLHFTRVVVVVSPPTPSQKRKEQRGQLHQLFVQIWKKGHWQLMFCPHLRKRIAVSLTTKPLPQNSISISMSYLVRPPEDGERKEGRWEPRVQHILIWKKRRRKKSAIIRLQSHIYILHVSVLIGFQHPVIHTGYHCRMRWNTQSTTQVITVGWAETSSQPHRLSL